MLRVASGERGLLDTNILIHADRLTARQLPQVSAVTTITLAELAAGVHVARDVRERARRLDLLQRVESEFDPLAFDASAARAYGRVVAAVVAAGRGPRGRVADQMIAAVALAHGLPLYTTNPADYAGLDHLISVVAVARP